MPDVPQGRISPNASPHVRATNDLYTAEQRIGGRLDNAIKSGGVLNLDSCERFHVSKSPLISTR